MKHRKWVGFGILAVALCLTLAACGAGMAEMDASYADNVTNGYFDKSENLEAEKDYVYGMDGGYPEAPAEMGGASVDATQYAEKVIQNVTLCSETRDFDRALADLRASAAALGGYEQSVNVTGKSYHSSDHYCRTARLILRIPSQSLGGFLGTVGDLVNVTSQNTSSSNVTAEYYDMEARIRVLETEREAYEEMLKKSDDVNYLLKIKDRLYNVIEEIESYKTQLRVYDNKVAYSTVTLTLEEVVTYTQVPTPKDSFGTRIANAFRDSWQDFADGFQRLTVWLVASIPTILVLLAIGGGAVAISLPLIRRSKKKRTDARPPESKQ